MFSDIFKVQITCFDVKTSRADIYGEDRNYEYCIYLLYNGNHYDPLVMNYDISFDSLKDITIFETKNKNIFEVMKYLVLEYKNQGDYIDFYSLECKICNGKFKDESDALEHSLNYDHWEFINI